MLRYNPKDIEPKWQKKWQLDGIYNVKDDATKPKRYVLEFFPYPSGAAMHVGHVRNYAIGDAVARYSRMQGFNVLHPMGWDGFGLPAENYAIEHQISPRKAIDDNVARFKKQLMQMGFSYDWPREIDSTDPAYYKWTQWYFLMLFKKGLAYQADSLQWWCPVDKTVLANEQVENGQCWRCGSVVEKKSLKQWFFKITDYADRLDKDLDDVDWSESIKLMQRNWIGRSRGVVIKFNADSSKLKAIEVFTTRPDTLYGATFMVLAPEHPAVVKITTASQKSKVESYLKETETKSEVERQAEGKEKTGVFTGAYATNPVNSQKIPIWVADFVMMGYGTGAIMAVPAHDERDWQFAQKFKLPITRVIKNDEPDDACSTAEGTLINSGKHNGLPSEKAREKITADLTKRKLAKEQVNYKMRDWLISRQRYWGAPIPIIHCPTHGAVGVPEDDLPVKLPSIKSYEPSGNGRSPLANVKDFVNTQCPKCGKPAQRETDTMDGFACSSWYFLRFGDPHNSKAPFDPNKVKYWLPVDEYIGGAEHAVMHLLYARFWVKVMFDEGLVNFNEPFKTLRNQGMILAPDGQKMSKSKHNTIEPDDLINQGYGADAIRLLELFIGPWNQSANWSVESLGGSFRFLHRVWTLVQEHQQVESRKLKVESKNNEQLLRVTHRTIKKVTEDLEDLGFNTAIAALMEMVNELFKLKLELPMGSKTWQWALETLVQLLAPFAPHISEELWAQLSQAPITKHHEPSSVHLSQWPKWDHKYLTSDTMTIVVQVNGKVRANIILPSDTLEKAVVESAQNDAKIMPYLKSGPKRTIYIPQKLVNFVV